MHFEPSMLLTIVFGFAFGFLLAIARVNRNSVIAGMATLDDFRVAKTMAAAIGVGAVLLAFLVLTGAASYHVKPLILGGVVYGGLLFGTGMAILGYCPGTLPISLGQGALDAGVGILGGLLGGLTFTAAEPALGPILGKDLGPQSLYSTLQPYPVSYLLVCSVFGILLVSLAFLMHRREKVRGYLWLYAGAGLGLLNAIMILPATAGRLLGASTSFPFVADRLLGFTESDYYRQIAEPGNWEMWFLFGAFLAGLVYSLARKEFRWQFLSSHWRKYRGENRGKRAFWAFLGGFILLFGARMAGGCTSGLILSGSMQLASSGLVFAAVVFIAFLVTGKLFYRGAKLRATSR